MARVSRRRLLRGGGWLAMFAALSSVSRGTAGEVAGAPLPNGMHPMGEGVDAAPYGLPSPFERRVARRWLRWLFPTTESAVNFTPLADLEGIITPNGLHFSRHHAGAPHIDPAHHRLLVHGMVERPMTFTLADLKRLPAVSRFHFLECAGNGAMIWRRPTVNAVQYSHGMLSCCQWTGARLLDVLRICGLKEGARWLLAESADAAGYARSVPRELWEEALLVFAQNGEALRPEQGYPLRLFIPGAEGAISVKWLHRLEVGDKPWLTREETARYADLTPDGRARLFTLVQEVKSVITSPSPERPLRARGEHQLSGLAWSGHGRIVGVDVSFDGGVNWRPAELESPVLPKCLTRFRLPFEWRGEELLLQSRAVDETGNVQPTYAENLRVKNDNAIYHNNSIITWQVMKSGEVRHVRLD